MFLLVSLSKSKFFTRVALVSFVQRCVSLASHSCRWFSNRVALVLHSCCSCLTLVALVLLVLHLCCIRVLRVTLVLLVSGTRVVNQNRSQCAIDLFPKNSFDTASGWSGCFSFGFSSAILLSKMKYLFFNLSASLSVTNLSTDYRGRYALVHSFEDLH